MSFTHGKNTGVLVDEFDLTAYLNQATVSKDIPTVDVTPFGVDDHQFLAGPEGGTISLSGMFDATAGASDVVLNTALGNAEVVSVAWPGFTTIGNRTVLSNLREVSYQIRSPINDAVRVTANMTADGPLRFGVVLKDLAAEASAANFTSVDNAASSANGAVGNLHVTAFTGTDATIKITDSADNSTFADLITFTVATGVTSENKTVAGTVNRYSRVELSGTFTTVTFAVTFARNQH